MMGLIGLVLVALASVVVCSPILNKLPEESMDVCTMISYYSYPCETHHVTTEDGYILTLQRIPHGRSSNNAPGYPVYLQHGIIDSAATFTMNLPHQSLSYILADSGFDVWLGNSRGNTYSNKHVNYTIHDNEFWDFSFDEMAKYDIPASIEYVLKQSNSEDLYYVGHSQGTSVAFAEFGRNQQLAKKIKTFFALAPVATVKHLRGLIHVVSKFTPEIEEFVKIFGIKDFLPSSPILKFLAQDVCGLVHVLEKVCGSVVFLTAGFDTSNMNETRLPIYLSHLPAGTSTKDIIHFAQMAQSGRFQMYDYGEAGNLKKYKQKTAPVYNISRVEVPTALFTATNDWLATPQDIEHSILPYLPNIVYKKNVEAWNHLDFVWGEDANTVIYGDIVKLMHKQLNAD